MQPQTLRLGFSKIDERLMYQIPTQFQWGMSSLTHLCFFENFTLQDYIE